MKKQLLFFVLISHAGISFGAAQSNKSSKEELKQTETASSTKIPRTPLMLAAKDGDCERISKLILTENADQFAQSASGRTPLMIAVEKKHLAAVHTLLNLCDDKVKLLSLTTKSGKSASDLSEYTQNYLIFGILESTKKQASYGPLCKTYFSPNILDAVLNCIDNEKMRIYGAMYSFTHGDPARHLVAKQNAGIPINLIINKGYTSDLCIALNYMIKNGISIRSSKLASDGNDHCGSFNMHHKYLIFYKNKDDKPLLLTGSCNFTDQAFNRNWENIIITDNRDSINAYLEEHTKLRKNSERIHLQDCSSKKDTATGSTAVNSRIRNRVNDLQ